MYLELPLLAESLLLYENAEVFLSEKSKQAKQNLPLIPYPRTIYYMIDVTWPKDRELNPIQIQYTLGYVIKNIVKYFMYFIL